MKKISIIGMGYVGLPLAVAFQKYYEVVGFDLPAAAPLAGRWRLGTFA